MKQILVQPQDFKKSGVEVIKTQATGVKQYPHKDKPAVQRYWHEGHHPEGCKGECMITASCGIDFCGRCSWSEYDNLIEK